MGTFSFAQCISQDTERAMFKGIAVDFLKLFQILELQSKGLLGSGVPVSSGQILIYNLKAKEKYSGKPTLNMIKRGLVSMHDHAVSNGVPEIKMPLSGSGLDKLDFRDVLHVLPWPHI